MATPEISRRNFFKQLAGVAGGAIVFGSLPRIGWAQEVEEALPPEEGTVTVEPQPAAILTVPDQIGELERDGVEIHNHGEKIRLSSQDFLALSAVAKAHGGKFRIEFYDEVENSPYSQYSNISEADWNNARLSGNPLSFQIGVGDEKERLRSQQTYNNVLPILFMVDKQEPDNSITTIIALGPDFNRRFKDEQLAMVSRGITIRVTQPMDFGILTDPAKQLIGRRSSPDSFNLWSGEDPSKANLQLVSTQLGLN